MDVTVFYAWQSDRPGKINRHFIRDAASDACKRITDDSTNHFRLTFDSDTRGVAGMCDIPATILEKIDTCDGFLTDLTFVGKTDDGTDREKLVPNPNVVFELGSVGKLLFHGGWGMAQTMV